MKKINIEKSKEKETHLFHQANYKWKAPFLTLQNPTITFAWINVLGPCVWTSKWKVPHVWRERHSHASEMTPMWKIILLPYSEGTTPTINLRKFIHKFSSGHDFGICERGWNHDYLSDDAPTFESEVHPQFLRRWRGALLVSHLEKYEIYIIINGRTSWASRWCYSNEV